MTAIIIGSVLSLLLLLIKQQGRFLKFKVLSFLISFSFCILSLVLTRDLGWWYVLLLPVCTLIGIIISLTIYPLTVKEVIENETIELIDYYNKLYKSDEIGTIITKYPFKNGYLDFLKKILFAFTSSPSDTKRIIQNLHSTIYYPVSKTKTEILVEHVHHSIDDVVYEKNYLKRMVLTNPFIYDHVFNIFICILQIHEIATNNLKRINDEIANETLEK